MSNHDVLSSLAMDLRRVAMGYNRGSRKLAQKFFQESIKRKDSLDTELLRPYLQDLIRHFPMIINQADEQKIAEDALTYSILFQNAAIKSDSQ